MAIFEFDTVIISAVNGTEQITPRDYRFGLIKSAKTLEEKISIAKHEGIKKLNGKLDIVNGSIIYEGVNVPEEILGASYYNYGTPEKLNAYVNGYIENNKKHKYNNLSGLFPFIDDGTLFSTEKITHQELKEQFWPNISNGVQKHLLNSFREYGIVSIIYSVGVFGSSWNPNLQIKMINDILTGDKGLGITKMVEKLEHMFKHKETINQWFEFDKPNKWAKIISQDSMWWDHVITMIENIDQIHKFNPSYVIPISYPFGELQSILNKIKHRLSGNTVVFNDYYYKYSFFDTLRIGDLTVFVPKDSVDMVDNGAAMNICVGDDKFINRLAKGRGMILFFFKDGKPFICAEKYLNKSDESEYANVEGNRGNNDGFQIMYKNNKIVTDEIRLTIKTLMNGMYAADKDCLSKFMSPEFLESRLKWLSEKVGKKMFAELKKTYLPTISKDVDLNTIFMNLPDQTKTGVKL